MEMAAKLFREGMSRLGAAVNIITSDGPEGKHGMTASAVCSITDSPPTLLVCVNQDNHSHDVFNGNGHLCVNVLGGQHVALSKIFAKTGGRDQDRFATGDWITRQTGAPVLSDAVVAFDCRILERKSIGSHSVFYARVEDVTIGHQSAQTLIWFDRGYHTIQAVQS